ncbi:epoxyqueuosine reductase QueG [Methanococcus maripaludis]|uniref:Epoxyqueuosine reductase QueG n=1 Tax=Methanococcus maripaludis TaxID=39152 RepID=A0A7J9P7H1_METMI|nr:epoxyqueuosine reductase [Methanococcus maripaludis]MBA2858754.1 epoxyqueuosine reductase QueG [Methanococcus maripaludis]
MEKLIENLIIEFVKNYSKEHNTKTKWLTPIVGFADSNDPEFLELKQVISEKHLTPKEVLSESESVICYFLPFEKEINLGNVKKGLASKDWAISYVETNEMIEKLNDYLSEKLGEMNHTCSKIPPTHNFDKEKLISYWSHRHVAKIAGLGTFGINNMLITEKGCNGRFGSLITSAKLKPSEKPDYEYCLYKYNGSCKLCIEKCEKEALKINEFNRKECYKVCLTNQKVYEKYGVADVCAKCLCNVPCSFKNPAKKLNDKLKSENKS